MKLELALLLKSATRSGKEFHQELSHNLGGGCGWNGERLGKTETAE